MDVKMDVSRILLVINVLCMTAENKTPLQDYRIRVFKAESCPKNKTEWRAAAKQLNCSIYNDPPVNQYFCLPSERKDMLVEFCYDKRSPRTEPGFCLELAGKGYLNYVNCTGFKAGCPSEMYFSEEIYLYQACLQINPIKKCYLAEEGCKMTATTFTMESTTNNNHSFETFTPESTIESNDYLKTVLAITSGLVLMPLLLLITLLCFFLKGRFKRSTSEQNNCLAPTYSPESIDPLPSETSSEKETLLNNLDQNSYTEKLTCDGSKMTTENSEALECEIQDLKIDGENKAFPSESWYKNNLSSDLGSTSKQDKYLAPSYSSESSCTLQSDTTSEEETPLNNLDMNTSSDTLTCDRSEGTSKTSEVLEDEMQDLETDGETEEISNKCLYKRRLSSDLEIPQARITLKDVYVTFGQSATIYGLIESSCKIERCTWQMLTERLDGTKIYRDLEIHLEKYKGSSNSPTNPIFMINKTTFIDHGRYRLIVENEKGKRGKSNVISLQVDGRKPSITLIGCENPSVAFNKSIVIETAVNALPAVLTYEWQKFVPDKGFETLNIDKSKYSGTKKSLLRINKIDFSDEGIYRAKFSNPIGDGYSQKFNIAVTGEIPKPSIKRKRFRRGTGVTIEAVFNSNLDVEYFKWQVKKKCINSKNRAFCDIDLNEDKYNDSYSDGRNAVLIIKDVQDSDKGKYRIVVKNTLGEGESIAVKVKTVNDSKAQSGENSSLSLDPVLNRPFPSQEAKLDCSETTVLPNAIAVGNFPIDCMRDVFDISWKNEYGYFISDADGNIIMMDSNGIPIESFKLSLFCKVLRHSLTEDGNLLFTGINSIMKLGCTNKKISSFIFTNDWEPQCIHISNLNGNILVGLLRYEESKVVRYDEQGRMQQCVQEYNGENLYLHPHYLTENHNGDILVSDQKLRAVVGVNKEGSFPYTYRGQGVKPNFYPYGLSTDNNGYIFILNFMDNDIHILDKNFRFIQILCFQLHTSPLVHPRALGTNGKNKLFVGHSLGGSKAEVRILRYRQDEEYNKS